MSELKQEIDKLEILQKYPTLGECQTHVQNKLWNNDFTANSIDIVECLYDYIKERLCPINE